MGSVSLMKFLMNFYSSPFIDPTSYLPLHSFALKCRERNIVAFLPTRSLVNFHSNLPRKLNPGTCCRALAAN